MTTNINNQQHAAETIGARVRKLRTAKGMTQLGLERKLIGPYASDGSRISKIEANILSPSFDDLRHLREIFDVSYDFLLDGAEHRASSCVELTTAEENMILELADKVHSCRMSSGSKLEISQNCKPPVIPGK